MPNGIVNKLHIYGSLEDIQKVKEFIQSPDVGIGSIDFNKITPIPPWIFQGDLTTVEEMKYGHQNCWHTWCVNNWGTKWNAYNQPDNRTTHDTIYFTTAWNGVGELISKLAWIFPNVIFEYSYADENIGYNVASYIYKDTKILQFNKPKPGTIEAYKLAFDTTQLDCSEYDLRYDPIVGNYIINKYVSIDYQFNKGYIPYRYTSPIVFAPIEFEDKNMYKNPDYDFYR
jgi:hypothetical protein